MILIYFLLWKPQKDKSFLVLENRATERKRKEKRERERARTYPNWFPVSTYLFYVGFSIFVQSQSNHHRRRRRHQSITTHSNPCCRPLLRRVFFFACFQISRKRRKCFGELVHLNKLICIILQFFSLHERMQQTQTVDGSRTTWLPVSNVQCSGNKNSEPTPTQNDCNKMYLVQFRIEMRIGRIAIEFDRIRLRPHRCRRHHCRCSSHAKMPAFRLLHSPPPV